jgi:glycosyltransferase involved in cell wall biosynthesis
LLDVRAFVVRTQSSADFFRSQNFERHHDRVHVVPFYMPYLECWESKSPQKPDPSKCLNFIFVGNQARRKGLDLFLLLKREVEKVPDLVSRFTVVSNFQDGSDFDLSGCEVHGGIGGAQVQDLMERAHYLALPSRSDSHPKVMYEGCAAGCALIYSDIRPLRDMWNGAGHVFPLSDSHASARKLAELLASRNGDLALGEANRVRFQTEFAPSVSMFCYRKLLQ